MWNKIQVWARDDASRWIILVNTIIFLGLSIPGVIFFLSNNPLLLGQILKYFELPLSFSRWIIQPWSVVTYQFLHSGPLHLLFNMIWLYWFGSLFKEYLGNRRVWIAYLGGGVFGGLLAMLAFEALPVFQNMGGEAFMVGASGSVLALVTGAATLLPDYEMSLLFFGRVKLRYIAFFVVLLDFLSLGSLSNPGGHLAHLGGALWGVLFVKSLYSKSFDFDSWIQKRMNQNETPVKKSKMKVVYQAPAKVRGVEVSHQPSQDEIDLILDKINESGYESLTPFEKEILFKASNPEENK